MAPPPPRPAPAAGSGGHLVSPAEGYVVHALPVYPVLPQLLLSGCLPLPSAALMEVAQRGVGAVGGGPRGLGGWDGCTAPIFLGHEKDQGKFRMSLAQFLTNRFFLLGFSLSALGVK